MDSIIIPQQLLINSHFQFTDYIDEIDTPAISNIVADTGYFYIRLIKRIKPFVIANFLPLGFSVALVIALTYPFPGKLVASFNIYEVNVVQAINSFNVFLVSGITLNITDSMHAIRKWGVLLFGLILILFVSPVFAFGIIKLPLKPDEFTIGLAIFCVVPTTLGVGVALTAASDGDQSLALLLTLITNCLGIVTVPFFLQNVLASSSTVVFDYASVFLKLGFTMLIPSIVGIALRKSSKAIATFANSHRVELSIFSSLNIVCIVWQSLSAASELLKKQSAENIIFITMSTTILHLFFLSVLYIVTTYVLHIDAPERVALIIMCSQKSAPVAITVISYITRSTSQQGLLSIPSLIGQLIQIFIGSLLAKQFKKIVHFEKDPQNI